MKTIQLPIPSLILALFLLLTACSKKPLTNEEFLSSSTYWDYAYGNSFLDGGSIACGFFNENGEALYIWAQAKPSADGKNIFYLKRSFNDPGQMEILPGSELEKKVLNLLETSHQSKQIARFLYSLEKLKEAIQFRDRPALKLLQPEIKADTSFYGTYEGDTLEPLSAFFPGIFDKGSKDDLGGLLKFTSGSPQFPKCKIVITAEALEITDVGHTAKLSGSLSYTREGKFILGVLNKGGKAFYFPLYILDENTLCTDGMAYHRVIKD